MARPYKSKYGRSKRVTLPESFVPVVERVLQLLEADYQVLDLPEFKAVALVPTTLTEPKKKLSAKLSLPPLVSVARLLSYRLPLPVPALWGLSGTRLRQLLEVSERELQRLTFTYLEPQTHYRRRARGQLYWTRAGLLELTQRLDTPRARLIGLSVRTLY